MATSYSSRADILKDISSGVLKTGDIFKRGNKEFIVKEGGKYQGYKGGADYQARALLMREGFNGQTEATQADQAYATGGITAVQEGIDAGTISSSSANTYSSGASNVTSDSGTNNSGSSYNQNNKNSNDDNWNYKFLPITSQDGQSQNISRLGSLPSRGDFINEETGVFNSDAYIAALEGYGKAKKNTIEENVKIATQADDYIGDLEAAQSQEVPSLEELKSSLRDDFFSSDEATYLEEEKDRTTERIERQIAQQEEINAKRVAQAEDQARRASQAYGSSAGLGMITSSFGIAEAVAQGRQENINQMISNGDLAIAELEDSLASVEAQYDQQISQGFNDYVSGVRESYMEQKEAEIQAVKDKLSMQRDLQSLETSEFNLEKAKKQEERTAQSFLDDRFYDAYKKGDGNIPAGALLEMAMDAGIQFDVESFMNIKTKEDMLEAINSNMKLAQEFGKLGDEERKGIINMVFDEQKKVQLEGIHNAIITDREREAQENLDKKQAEADIRVGESQRKKSGSTSSSSNIGNKYDAIFKQGISENLSPEDWLNYYGKSITTSGNERARALEMYTDMMQKKYNLLNESIEDGQEWAKEEKMILLENMWNEDGTPIFNGGNTSESSKNSVQSDRLDALLQVS